MLSILFPRGASVFRSDLAAWVMCRLTVLNPFVSMWIYLFLGQAYWSAPPCILVTSPYMRPGQCRSSRCPAIGPDLSIFVNHKQSNLREKGHIIRDLGWKFRGSWRQSRSSWHRSFPPLLQDLSSPKQFYFSALAFA
jgi:hypothetical protein